MNIPLLLSKYIIEVAVASSLGQSPSNREDRARSNVEPREFNIGSKVHGSFGYDLKGGGLVSQQALVRKRHTHTHHDRTSCRGQNCWH